MPKVSVIVPVYNVKKYLRKCLNSIISQTLDDIEIICVDDGSTDECPLILDSYAAWDKRIKVIHKKNGGYGHSMNVGLDAATGEYIGIVESDDMILPEMYHTLHERAKQFDLDIVKSDCFLWWESFLHMDYCRVDDTGKYYNQILTEYSREQMFLFWMFTWSGIYRRSFLLENNIRWNETPGASYQDNGFWVQTMSMAKRAMWIDSAFYLYRQDNPASSMKDKKKMMAMQKEYDFVERILSDKGLERERKIANYFRLQEHIVTYRRISDELKSTYRDIVAGQLEKYKNDITLMRGDRDSDWVIIEINDIIQDTNDTDMCLVKRKENLDKRLREAEHILFYGTGIWANNGWKRLYMNGYTDLIDMVTETDPTEGKVFWGRPVRSIDEFDGDKEKTLVIIAVGESLYPEIETLVKEKGFCNYIGIVEIAESLWAM